MENSNKKVAIYCRVASENRIALDEQVNEVLSYINKTMNLRRDEVEVFADNGFSGMSFDRPALFALDEAIVSGAVGTVVVRDITRVGRDMPLVSSWIRWLEETGVTFIVSST